MKRLKDFKTKRALKKKVEEQDLLISHLQRRVSNLVAELDMERSLKEYYKRGFENLKKGGNTYQEDIKEAV